MTMLWTIVVILIVMWMLGMVSAYTMGGFIHILLVLAVVALVIQLINGRRLICNLVSKSEGAGIFHTPSRSFELVFDRILLRDRAPPTLPDNKKEKAELAKLLGQLDR